MADVGHILAPRKIWLLCLAGLVTALVMGISQDKGYLWGRTGSRAPVSAAKPIGERKVFPLSVIGGGAYSAEELNRARRIDPVVRAHYADFGGNPTLQSASKDLLVYVSYRKSDAVYWTRAKRRIPQGESVLSDGKNLARARCGNRLSFTPQQPTSPENELSEEAFDTPEAPKISLPADVLPPPETEADLYVPPGSVPAQLLSSLLSPPLLAASGPSAPSWAGGGYPSIPAIPGGGISSFGGGAPFLARGSGLPVRTGAGSGASASVPIAVNNFIAVSTPEPTSAKLLFLSALILVFFYLRGSIHLRP